jgi:hypothetical protein
MKQADRIRLFVKEEYVQPARVSGVTEIVVRAGDVHKEMGLANALPAVCAAVGSSKFETFAGVRAVAKDGPANGSNVFFRFEILPSAGSAPLLETPVVPALPPSPKGPPDAPIDLRGSLVLVSCVKSKLAHPAPARVLYTSAWFTKVRDLLRDSGARWFILSALYGLVDPDDEIQPYDYTLNRLGVAERRAWASNVINALKEQLGEERRIVLFAGLRYREFLIGPLTDLGLMVEAPMEGLRQGEQLAWLRDEE